MAARLVGRTCAPPDARCATFSHTALFRSCFADDCAIVTVIHRDNPVSLSRVRNSLSTAVATSSPGSQARGIKDYMLSPELSFASLVDPDCGCIRDTYLEAELRVCSRAVCGRGAGSRAVVLRPASAQVA